MLKRRANRYGLSRVGAIGFALLAATFSGCKEKPAPVPQKEVLPMPKKAVQQRITSAGKATVPPGPGGKAAPVAAVAPAAAKVAVQKQVSTAKPALLPGGISLDFANRRDPFRPFVQAPPQQATARSAKHVKDALPIQSFDAEKFRVSGIITGVKENSALVIAPNGKGYVVREGMLIGSNDGRVKRITNSTVEVEESFRDDNGRMKKRLVILALIRKK